MITKDKFSAVWLSHSSIRDYLACPRLYYLRNVYKNPRTGHKMTVMQPALAVGQVVHEILESLSTLPVEARFSTSLVGQLDPTWEKIKGKKGGFINEVQEEEYKARALEMLRRVELNPGPLGKKAIKIKSEGGLPWYWFSEEDNIILCGKIDWLEYMPESDSVHIIDFKTGKHEEDPDSLQLLIYRLLVANCQNRQTAKASYWYLVKDDQPREVELPDLEEAQKRILEIGKKIKLARKINHLECRQRDGCVNCLPLEMVLAGKGEQVGVSDYNQDIYILKDSFDNEKISSF